MCIKYLRKVLYANQILVIIYCLSQDYKTIDRKGTPQNINNIKNLIIKAKHINNELTSLPSNLYICKVEIDCIPTLQTGIYRRISPMLRERYNNFGSWENATHGDWLSIDDMKEL